MDLVLPPRISPKGFDAALKAFAAALGPQWVMASDEDRSAYADLYAPGPEDQWPPSAAVAPASGEEVQAVLRIAQEHGIPLWSVSRGKNLGYGQAAPRMAGTVVLDLGRMNKIHEIDEALGYAVIEPDVSFFDLYEELQRRGGNLWMSVPGNGWGSVLGNALDHGIGYSPWRDLPAVFGKWNTVFKRYRDWVQADIFQRLFDAASDDPDMEFAMVDGTIVKVHRHGQGAKGGRYRRPAPSPTRSPLR